MQVHNHRIAMNTRLANRSAIHRRPDLPIDPCEDMLQAQPHGSTYKFTTLGTRSVVVMVLRRTALMAVSVFKSVDVGGATIAGQSNKDTRVVGGAVLFVWDLVHDEGVEVEFSPKLVLDSDFDPEWNMVMCWGMVGDMSAFGANGSAVGNSQFSGYGLAYFPSANQEMALIFTATTMLPRGSVVHSNPNSNASVSRICTGRGVDRESIDPVQPSGGHYGLSIIQAIDASKSVRISGNWNTNPLSRSEVGASYVYTLIRFRGDDNLRGAQKLTV